MIVKLKNKILSILGLRKTSILDFWEDRAKRYGKRSVLNISHTDEEMEEVTNKQSNKLFPILENELNGNEKIILDFGCGPGRFTLQLANLIKGHSIGVDPIQHLLDLAPKSEKVVYKKIKNGIIPMNDNSCDVIWICLVLGGIIDQKVLNSTIKEIDRISKKDALLVLVENTSEKVDIGTWKYRNEDFYINLFSRFNLKNKGHYFDLDEKISIMSGRKVNT